MQTPSNNVLLSLCLAADSPFGQGRVPGSKCDTVIVLGAQKLAQSPNQCFALRLIKRLNLVCSCSGYLFSQCMSHIQTNPSSAHAHDWDY